MSETIQHTATTQTDPGVKPYRLVVLGAGESGIGAALLGKQQGYEVFVSDGGPIKDKYKNELVAHAIAFEEGHHTEEKILNATEVMKSPGIPEKNELVKKNSGKRHSCD